MQLTNFMRAIEERKAEIGYHQFWRYTKAGRLPKAFAWLAQHPALVEALAADAREMQAQRTIQDTTGEGQR
jgi:hypothetical protein